MANQNFRVKNGLEVGGVEVISSSGAINTSSFGVSGVTAGTVGNSTTIPVITVDAAGVVTNLQSASVSGVSDFTYTAANTTFVLSTGDGSTYAQTITYSGSFVTNSTGIHIKANTGITANSTGIFADASGIDHDSLSNFVANEHIDHSLVSITAGNGLTGGGSIEQTRTLSAVGGTGVTSNSSGIHIGQDVSTTASVTFADLTVTANAVISDLYDSSNRVLKIYNSTGTVVWG